MPDTPTTYELGYKIGAPAWSGFFGPPGISAEIRRQLSEAFREAYKTPEWEKLCRERGMQPQFLASDEFEKFALAQEKFFSGEIPRLLRMQR